MRIAVFHNVPGGGAKRAVFEMVKGLSARGHSLIEVTPAITGPDRYSLERYTTKRKAFQLDWPVWRRRIPFITPYLHMYANMLGFMRYHRLSRQLARWLETQSVDVLFANDCSILLNPPVVGYARVPSLLYVHHGSHLSCEAISPESRRTPSIVESMKTLYYCPATLSWKTLRYQSERWAARRACAVACNSRLAQRLIFKAYRKQSRVIHVAVDGQRFKPPVDPVRANYVMSAGAITAHKDFGFLIQSLSILPMTSRPRLVIASAHAEVDELSRLAGLADQLQVDLQVVHPQSDEELARLYSEAQAFVFSAQHEAFGLVVLEAMACATPVVGVEDGGYVDCLVEGGTGFVSARQPQAFAEAVMKVLQDAALRDEMGRYAREHVLTFWNWKRTAAELDDELTSVVKR